MILLENPLGNVPKETMYADNKSKNIAIKNFKFYSLSPVTKTQIPFREYVLNHSAAPYKEKKDKKKL